MTSPRQSRARSGRRYVWPPQPPHELEVPSSTTILGILDKPALLGWASRMVAEYAVEHRDAWSRLPTDEAVALLKGAPWRNRNRKANVGTAVHTALEAYVTGQEPDEELAPERRGYYEAALAFLRDHEPKITASEVTVYSRRHEYAGTLDLLGEHGGEATVMDYKTGKDVYPEMALQLCSYAYGDFIGHDDGREEPLPEIRRGIVIRLGANGRYKAVPVSLPQELFEVFLALRRVWSWKQNAESYLGPPLRKAA